MGQESSRKFSVSEMAYVVSLMTPLSSGAVAEAVKSSSVQCGAVCWLTSNHQ